MDVHLLLNANNWVNLFDKVSLHIHAIILVLGHAVYCVSRVEFNLVSLPSMCT